MLPSSALQVRAFDRRKAEQREIEDARGPSQGTEGHLLLRRPPPGTDYTPAYADYLTKTVAFLHI